MVKTSQNKSLRLDLLIASLIAVASVTFALTAWRISLVSSSAGDASRQGLIDAIKVQAFTSENWQQVYEEANAAENYSVYLAEVDALESSSDPALADQAANLRQYLLPNLLLLAGPLATDPIYQNPDGTYDLQKRFDRLQAETPDLRTLDPQVSFQLADRYSAEQRWLTVAAVLVAISLFWLALAEVGGKRWRVPVLIIGASVFALALVALAVIEVVFYF